MHQAKKGNQWHFGMKEHIGVDPVSGLVHSVVATAANVHDVTVAHELVREGDAVLYGDYGHLGLDKRDEMRRFDGIEYKINRKPSTLKASPKDGRLLVAERDEEHRKSSVRCKVEHIFLIVKRDFGYAKARYRGIAKNAERLRLLFAFANIVKCIRAGRAEEFCRGRSALVSA